MSDFMSECKIDDLKSYLNPATISYWKIPTHIYDPKMTNIDTVTQFKIKLKALFTRINSGR